MRIRRIANILGSAESGSYRSSCAGILLIFFIIFLTQSAGVCRSENSMDSIKKWLRKSPKQTGVKYSSDKRAVQSMLEALRLRKEEVLRKEQEIKVSHKSLMELQEQLKEQMTAIKEVEDAVKDLLKKAEAEKQGRLDSLVSLYGTMNSQNAASALLELYKKDAPLVSAIFQSLNKKRAAIILDAITAKSPSTTAEITMHIGRSR